MALVRLPVSRTAMILILAMPVMARAQEPSSGAYMLDRAASTVGFTVYGSAIFKIKQDGYFKDFNGLIAYDPARPADTGYSCDLPPPPSSPK